MGRLMQLTYIEAAVSESNKSITREKWDADSNGIEPVRSSLDHPLDSISSVSCVIASVHGMDSESAPERFIVASKLWSHGISAEYLPQSGVMISLLKQSRHRSEALGSQASDWSLDELCGVCMFLKIKSVVIVQPHLLRDKGSVRLRSISQDKTTTTIESSSTSSSERFVDTDKLAQTIHSGILEKTPMSSAHHHMLDSRSAMDHLLYEGNSGGNNALNSIHHGGPGGNSSTSSS